MLQLPASHLRMIHEERLAEFESIAREKLLADRGHAPGVRRRLGRVIARFGASIASEPVRREHERAYEPACE